MENLIVRLWYMVYFTFAIATAAFFVVLVIFVKFEFSDFVDPWEKEEKKAAKKAEKEKRKAAKKEAKRWRTIEKENGYVRWP